MTGIQKNEHYLRMNKGRVHNISNVFTIQPEKKKMHEAKTASSGRMHTRVRATFRPKLKLKNKKKQKSIFKHSEQQICR